MIAKKKKKDKIENDLKMQGLKQYFCLYNIVWEVLVILSHCICASPINNVCQGSFQFNLNTNLLTKTLNIHCFYKKKTLNIRISIKELGNLELGKYF